MPTAAPRRTQHARRAATQAKLLDAAVDCLIERGFAGTTVSDVQDRAGVARGTLLHHFPTKDALLTAAVSHLAARRAERWAVEIALLPAGRDRLDALVDLAWRDLSSPTFFAGLELWVAARTDPALRAALLPVEADLFRLIRDSLLSMLGERASDRRAATLVQFTVDALTGVAMSTILSGTDGSREVLIRRWKRALHVLFGELDADALTGGR